MYNEAIKIANANKHLIGKTWKGARIEDVIIVPTDQDERNTFWSLYYRKYDSHGSIAPFAHGDVEVLIICDRWRARKEGLLCVTSIYELPQEYKSSS